MFSPNEEQLLKLIKKKPVSITELADKFYGKDIPFEANKRVAGMVNRIAAKLESSGETWRIASEGGGRGGKSVWREDV